MSAIIDNAARAPMLVAKHISDFPVTVNDYGVDDMEQVAKILARSGQMAALQAIAVADGVSARMKGIVARVLDQHRQRMH